MALIVQKYGGTSVGNADRIRNVAKRVKAHRDRGDQVVVVVSARSGVTNELIDRAKSLNPNPDEREMDALLAIGEQETIALTAIALHAIGVPAVSRTGPQAGIITDDAHTRARILDVTGGDIKGQLDDGKVVIVAGFQGLSQDHEVTTLGRGGSDLSAIALAWALKADICQIYTDVDGVYTADPRVVPDARKLDVLSYDEMLELASSGSKVMQARSVEFAQKYDVIFEVRSSFNDEPGTIVKAEAPNMEQILVRGVAVDKNQVKLTLSELPDRPGVAAMLFQSLGADGVVVDMIIQNIGRGGLANISFTVAKEDLPRSEKVAKDVIAQLGGGKLLPPANMAKVSAVGIGMRTHSGVAAKFFGALAKAGVNILMITTSEIKISVAIDLADADAAARAVHAAFDLGQA
ncbi:MAG TPA: aspartate kinase [Opitutales bacterium]|nr:aspartate kinase [Opitutales bacterium]